MTAWALGLGCDRGTPVATLMQAVQEALAQVGGTPEQVQAVASIDLKADEAGLQQLAQLYGWSIRFYPAPVLARVPVPNPSETVRKYTGTPSVSEAAALLVGGGNTPLPASALRVEKHKRRGADGRNATVSVASLAQGEAAAAGAANDPYFADAARDTLYRIMAARRDMRHFTPGASVAPDVLARIVQAAYLGPSVGLMQPWHLIRITRPQLRAALAELVDAERLKTGEALQASDGRREEFLALKVEGLRECAELLAVVLPPDDGTVFGRRTMPRDMALVSLGCAMQNLWLAARAENLGLGWVSLFDPTAVGELLQLPAGAKALGLLCLGPVPAFYDRPMLSALGWRQPRALDELLSENSWNTTT